MNCHLFFLVEAEAALRAGNFLFLSFYYSKLQYCDYLNKFAASSSIIGTAFWYLVSLRRFISASSWLLTRYCLILVLDCLKFQMIRNTVDNNQTTGSSSSSSTGSSSRRRASALSPGSMVFRQLSSWVPIHALALHWIRAWSRSSSWLALHSCILQIELWFGLVLATLS